MASYQDIDTRLKVVEDKIDLIMKLAHVTKAEPSTLMPGETIVRKMSMMELYRELKTAGEDIEEVKGNGSVS